MRLARNNRGKWVMELEEVEKAVFVALLSRYPTVPPAYQPLTRAVDGPGNDADQRLLEEALAEHRQETRRRVEALLKGGRRLKTADSGFRLVLDTAEVEWLLQALNDVRVGSWIALGSPELDAVDFALNKASAAHAWAMEMAGYFQAGLLRSLDSGGAN